jgi:hypothetical protein
MPKYFLLRTLAESTHPFAFNMPESHSIKGASITDVYEDVVKFFNKFGIEFRS